MPIQLKPDDADEQLASSDDQAESHYAKGPGRKTQKILRECVLIMSAPRMACFDIEGIALSPSATAVATRALIAVEAFQVR